MNGTSTNQKKAQPKVIDTPPSPLLNRILDNIFPKVPDFFGLLNDQCEIMAQTMEALVVHMERGGQGNLIRQLEGRGDEVKARNLAILAKAFATPLDREDIYRAIMSIDMIPNYAKSTVREMEVLELAPDPYMLEMVQIMNKGTAALYRGFSKQSFDPLGAVEDEQAVHASEYAVETCYRKALAALFDGDEHARQMLENQEEGIEVRFMAHTIEIFKHRELYRHLSNLGDCVFVAGTVLYDIMVQV